uniref:CSON013452 protein n=1 Tax=Culicoides sonorensis TaxID=179676 RepID=A0A336MAX5_CULSO
MGHYVEGIVRLLFMALRLLPLLNWTLVVVFCFILPVLSTPFDDTPVDYLIPPPIQSQKETITSQRDETSLLRRITSWMFSFGRSNDASNENIVSSPSEKVKNYEKPPTPAHNNYRDIVDVSCSPCNKIPWIPILSKSQIGKVNQNIQTISTFTEPHQETTKSDINQEHFLLDSSVKSAIMSTDFPYITFTSTAKTIQMNKIKGVTNPEYLPPRQILPIENENQPFAPIPIPNLSMTPIPPLHEAKPFLYNPYKTYVTHTKFIPTFSNGSKYIEQDKTLGSGNSMLEMSENDNETSNKLNFEILKSNPSLHIHQSTIHDNYNIFNETLNNDIPQTTIRSFFLESDYINNQKQNESKILDKFQSTLHFNKSESMLLPISVKYRNISFSNSTNMKQSIDLMSVNNTSKPIRFIVPYITQQKPSPFRAKFLRNNENLNWSTLESIDQEVHDTQESFIVTATVPTPSPPVKTTKYIAKFLASSIKELLNNEKIASSTKVNVNKKDLEKEHDVNFQKPVPFDLTTLQQNIDKWTEEEFGSTSETTATALGMLNYTKSIPVEFITESIDLPNISIDTSNPITSELFPTNKVSQHTILHNDSLDSVLINRLKSSFKSAKAYSNNVSNRKHEQWKNLEVSISPLTNEKLYIVTPQTEDIQQFEEFPRFRKRPTPSKNNYGKIK